MNKTSPRIAYRPRAGATPESERNALAAVYRFILFESRASKEGGQGTALDVAMKGSKLDYTR